MSPRTTTPLVRFLREEAHRLDVALGCSAAWKDYSPVSPEKVAGMRLPIEFDGSVWSAEIREVADDHVELMVDREAVGRLDAQGRATIRFQPENGRMQAAIGRISSIRPAGDQILLDFRPV